LDGEGDEFVDFSRADVGAIVGEIAFLQEFYHDDSPEGTRERFQFEETALRDLWIGSWRNNIYEDGARFEERHVESIGLLRVCVKKGDCCFGLVGLLFLYVF
jgi:hypothetical protein